MSDIIAKAEAFGTHLETVMGVEARKLWTEFTDELHKLFGHTTTTTTTVTAEAWPEPVAAATADPAPEVAPIQGS